MHHSAAAAPTARDRELFRYFQPNDISGKEKSPTTRSSNDPILTAFAQLGALRLNAKRGLITLSTRRTEYVIAEAGKTLSIQAENDDDDPLWHGVAEVKCIGLGHDLVDLFSGAESPPYAVVNDTSKHDTFKHRAIVVEAPFIRFIACVPLRVPSSSIVIGNYIVVDDQPRDGLSEAEIRFMIDMGATVMDYLEAGRIKQKQHRAERMIKAIGLFIEGKASLREWWLQGGHQAQHSVVKKRVPNTIPLEQQADLEFGVQDPVYEFSTKDLKGFQDHNMRPSMPRSLSSSSLSLSVRGDGKKDGRPLMPNRDSIFSSSDASTYISRSLQERNSSVTTLDVTTEPTLDPEERHHSVAFDLPPETISPDASKQLQEALFSTDLRGVFSRASNLIREAIAVDGVIFFDASIGSFGGSSEKDAMEERGPGGFDVEKLVINGEDDIDRKSSEAEFDTAREDSAHQTANPFDNCCGVLGFSTRRRSSLKGHASVDEHRQFPETVLRKLLKRYPHGKVFNFEDDGSFSCSDADNGGHQAEFESRKHNSLDKTGHRQGLSRDAEAAAILSVLPKARSVFWFPLWDQGKERWFAGSLLWSASPTRVLCPVEDLTYLAAFGNSIMAEVSRLSAQVLAQMKTDFISSISHELRSPLHGVLASVELLQETSLTEVQTDLINNVHASGRVLLDTINHVLDFSKVNRKSKNKGMTPKYKSRRSKKPLSEPENEILDANSEDIADVCILSEEVIESIYAGRNITKRAFDASYRQNGENRLSSGSNKSSIAVIMDIGYHPSWKFEIDAGAWRRILMNLFSNALKYTKEGFVKVSLQVEDDLLSRSGRPRSILTLRVKDSGKGISKEFLKHRLFKPFTQEDSLAAGAGLGLSIVRHIVHDLGGEISFVSEQGAGTEATVRIPLPSIPPNQTDIGDSLAEVRLNTKGLKFCLEGFDRYPDISETPTGILSADSEAAMFLKSSVNSLMIEWFDMDAVMPSADRSSADVIIIMESGLGGKSVNGILQSYNGNVSTLSAKTIAIVLSGTYPTSKISSYGRFKIFYLPQPYGPHKVAKILQNALHQNFADIPQTHNEPQIKPPVLPSETSSSKSTTVVFAEQVPVRRHSVQPSLNLNFAATVVSTELREVREQNAEKSDGNVSADPIAKNMEAMRVLLVEDNEINLKILVAYMRKLKLNHATACNGLEAVNAYKSAHGEERLFDVIFMDISMPIMSGIESTRHIRRFERENSLDPVALIALTGAANPNTRQEAFSSGVDLFLTKPVPMKSLKVLLDDLKVNGRQNLAP